MQPKYTFNNDNSSDPFDDWFNDTRGTELDDDVDQTEEDDYSDNSWE